MLLLEHHKHSAYRMHRYNHVQFEDTLLLLLRLDDDEHEGDDDENVA